jgi:hypothetical protein
MRKEIFFVRTPNKKVATPLIRKKIPTFASKATLLNWIDHGEKANNAATISARVFRFFSL